jgi:hypothetical protein
MTIRLAAHVALILLIIGVFAATLPAQTSNQATINPSCPMPCATQPSTTSQQFTGSGITSELYVNAGGVWPPWMDEFDNNKIRAQGIYGLKGGVIFGGGAELEGSFGVMNHFGMRNPPNPFDMNTDGTFGQPGILAFMYDVNGVWNMGNRRFFGARFNPYVAVGGGGLTAEVRHGSSAFLQGGGLALDASGTVIPNPGPIKVINDGDTFFTVNYGGGLKVEHLWGPVGVRADFRGRTVPNYFHSSPTWLELTGGLLLSFGER